MTLPAFEKLTGQDRCKISVTGVTGVTASYVQDTIETKKKKKKR